MDDALTVVVLNWRTPALALDARASLLADGVPAERVLLVDNGSGDESPAALAQGAYGSPVLALPDNLGFAAANNRAAGRLPASDCYLFVNADARVHARGSVAALVGCVSRPEVAVAVPRLRNPDLSLQRSVVPLAAVLPELVRASGLSRLVPDRWQPVLGTHWDHGASRSIQAADGAVLAVDARAFAAVGGFDERSFMYGEDHALFRALRRAGRQARFVAEAEFVHVGAAASGQRWDPAARARRVAHAEATLLLAGDGDGDDDHGDGDGHGAWGGGRRARRRADLAARAALAVMTLGAGVRALSRLAAGDRPAAAVHAARWRGYRTAAAASAGGRGQTELKCGDGTADWT